MQELKPFSSGLTGISLFASMRISGGILSLDFKLDDPEQKISGAPFLARKWIKKEVARADELWRETCFEAFWARAGEPSYWELNLAANGRWALYQFDEYRKPFPPRSNSDFELSELATGEGTIGCALEAKVPFSDLDFSLCAVLKTKVGQTYYFSTKHAGEKPDFHLRNSFTLNKGTK